jgi:hypothetical protein
MICIFLGIIWSYKGDLLFVYMGSFIVFTGIFYGYSGDRLYFSGDQNGALDDQNQL